jgi:hypothetical protein
VKEFSTDKDLKKKTERFIQERQNKDRNKSSVAIDGFEKPAQEKVEEPIKATVAEDLRPKFKPVGKIDSDNLGKKPAPKAEVVEEPKKEETPAPVVVEEKPASVEEPKKEEKPVEKPAPVVVKEEVKEEPKSVAPKVESKPVETKKEEVEEKSEKGELGREDKKDGDVPASGNKRVSSRSVVILLGLSSLVFILVAVCSLFWFIDYKNEKDYAFTSPVKQLADPRDSPQTQELDINDPEEAEEKSDSSGKGKPGSSVGALSDTDEVEKIPRKKK